MSRLPVRALVAASLLSLPLLLSASIQAEAASPPFKDPAAVATLGFCDAKNRPITSGSVMTQPFAAKTVSNQVAAPAYAAAGRKATLYAYSPVQNTPPGDWSPFQMAATSEYTNAKHPMAAQTPQDAALVWHTGAFPPTWNGLVQVRLVLSAPDAPVNLTQYGAAIIRVDGKRWTLVSGDRSPACTAGTAKTLNQLINTGLHAGVTPAASLAASKTHSSATASPTAAPAPGASTTANTDTGATTAEQQGTASSSSRPFAFAALGLLAVAIVAAGAVGVFAARRG